MSAKRLGSVMSRSAAAMRPAPRLCKMFSSTARYSRASSLTAGVGSTSLRGSASTQRASPVPGTPVPMVARCATLDGHGGQPAGQVALLHDVGDHADAGEAALDVGHQQQATARGPGGLDGGPRLVRLERHGENHPWQHDPGLEGEQWECHVLVRHRVCVLL